MAGGTKRYGKKKAKYTVQKGRTLRNKRKALTAHIKGLGGALAAANDETKIKNVNAAIADTNRALAALVA